MILYKFLTFISLISIWGFCVYQIYALNTPGLLITLILSISTYNVLEKKYFTKLLAKKITKNKLIPLLNIKFNLLTLVFVILLFACLVNLFTYTTTKSIITPWEVLTSYFFVFYFLLLLVSILILLSKQNKSVFVVLIYALSFLVSVIVYKIGYGFDPFVHQATLDLIIKNGFAEPKSLYYIGEYVLELFAFNFLPISLIWVNKLFIPLLAAILLPLATIRALTALNLKNSALTILLLLILPYSFFIVTTPQALAYLYLLLIIIISLDYNATKDKAALIAINLLALASFVTQPIAGIPAILFAVITSIQATKLKKSKTLNYIIYTSLVFLLPLIFYFLNLNLNPVANVSYNSIFNTFNFPSFFTDPTIPAKEGIILNFIYLIKNNFAFIVIILALFGFFFAKKINLTRQYFYFSLGLFTSYLLTSSLNFSFLIDYEQKDFANRILYISSFFLLPYILVTLNWIAKKTINQNTFIKTSILTFFAILITTSLYLSYPRHDNYFNSRGYSTGELDIEAVSWINTDAGDTNYVVLANQQVSAASLREYGFAKYYKANNEQIFYYPIPTGGTIYQLYLDMVYLRPEYTTIEKALDLVGVDTGYFVLNKYWWAFDKIRDEAKLEADSFKVFGNEDVIIFKYKKKSTNN